MLLGRPLRLSQVASAYTIFQQLGSIQHVARDECDDFHGLLDVLGVLLQRFPRILRDEVHRLRRLAIVLRLDGEEACHQNAQRSRENGNNSDGCYFESNRMHSGAPPVITTPC